MSLCCPKCGALLKLVVDEPPSTTSPSETIPNQKPRYATNATKKWLLEQIGEQSWLIATDFCREAKMLKGVQSLVDLPLQYVPVNQEQLRTWLKCMNEFVDGHAAVIPFVNWDTKSEKVAKTKDWRSVSIHFGSQTGAKLGEMEPSLLAWWVNNFEVKGEFESGGKMIRKSALSLKSDRLLRTALDQAQAELGIEDDVAFHERDIEH